MRVALLSLLAIACAPDSIDEAEFDVLPSAVWDGDERPVASPLPPPAPGVGIEGTPLIVGQRTTFALFGLNTGDTAYFALDTDPPSPGAGPCMSGSCLDLPSPRQLGSDVANNQGIARVRVTVPPGAPPQAAIHVQAFIERGGTVLTSPVWTDFVQVDNDADGYTAASGDCDDSDDSVYPGAPEVCDGLDNDCNAIPDDGGACGGIDSDADGLSDDDEVAIHGTDPYNADTDGDGLLDGEEIDCGANPLDPSSTCSTGGGFDADGDGYDTSLDCDDSDARVYPGAMEVCDGLDNDCDGVIDNGCP